MKTILKNGLQKDVPYFLDDSGVFGIQEYGELVPDRIFYPGDSINYELDQELVSLYDFFRDLVFMDTEQYYKELELLPQWIQDVGQNSDWCISADEFAKLISEKTIPHMFEHLYLVDCQYLVRTIQNLLCAMESLFVSYYQLISSFPLGDDIKNFANQDGVLKLSSISATQESSVVESYFTKAYSVLDITCKICYEIQHINTEFSTYRKLRSANKLWGDRANLVVYECEGTIFERCELMSNIEAIRNEIVHSGTWEFSPTIFIRINKGEEVERFMLYPDMQQGHLATVKNRRHFFASGNKLNDILPATHMEFKRRLISTIVEIKRVYACEIIHS